MQAPPWFSSFFGSRFQNGAKEHSFFPNFRLWIPKTVQRSALCRSRRVLSNQYLLAKFGFDTADNEPSKVCRIRSALRGASARGASTARRARAKLGRPTLGSLSGRSPRRSSTLLLRRCPFRCICFGVEWLYDESVPCFSLHSVE